MFMSRFGSDFESDQRRLILLVSNGGCLARRTRQLRLKLTIKSGCQRKPGKVLKMSTEGGQQNKFHSGGVLDKYTKHRFLTVLLLEIRASLYSTPSEAIFIRNLSPFSETHRTRKI